MVGFFLGCLSLESCSRLRSGDLRTFFLLTSNISVPTTPRGEKKKPQTQQQLSPSAKNSGKKLSRKLLGQECYPPTPPRGQTSGFVPSLQLTYRAIDYLLFIQGDFSDVPL